MSYIEKRIAKQMREDPEYREAMQEEVSLLSIETERRKQLMSIVAKLRKAQRLTQVELAKKLHVSQARVSQMERGMEPISVDGFLRMVEALNGEIAILAADEVKALGVGKKLLLQGTDLMKAKQKGTKKRSTKMPMKENRVSSRVRIAGSNPKEKIVK